MLEIDEIGFEFHGIVADRSLLKAKRSFQKSPGFD